jgi:hypothetical protein
MFQVHFTPIIRSTGIVVVDQDTSQCHDKLDRAASNPLDSVLSQANTLHRGQVKTYGVILQ